MCLRVAVRRGCRGELASGRPLCCCARAGQAGEEREGMRRGGGAGGCVGEGEALKQQRAAGAIIPPNAPCLPCVCRGSLVSGRLSALLRKVTWAIKCSPQGWVFFGGGWGRIGCLSSLAAVGLGWLGAAVDSGGVLSLIQQSPLCASGRVVMHYVTDSVMSGQ